MKRENSVVVAFENLLKNRLQNLTAHDEVERTDLLTHSEVVIDFLHGVNTQRKKSVKEAADFCIAQARIYNDSGHGWAAEPWCEAAEILYRYSGATPRRSWWEYCYSIHHEANGRSNLNG